MDRLLKTILPDWLEHFRTLHALMAAQLSKPTAAAEPDLRCAAMRQGTACCTQVWGGGVPSLRRLLPPLSPASLSHTSCSYNPRFRRLLPFLGLDHTTSRASNGTVTVGRSSYNFYFTMQQCAHGGCASAGPRSFRSFRPLTWAPP